MIQALSHMIYYRLLVHTDGHRSKSPPIMRHTLANSVYNSDSTYMYMIIVFCLLFDRKLTLKIFFAYRVITNDSGISDVHCNSYISKTLLAFLPCDAVCTVSVIVILSVRPSVCHTRGLCPHGSTYDHDFFTTG